MLDGGLVLVGLAALVGAMGIRLAGLGTAMIAGPVFVLVLGPYEGVLLANCLTMATNVVVLTMVWREVELRKAVWLLLPAWVMVPVGVWVARALPPRFLLLMVGGSIVAAGAALVAHRVHIGRGRFWTIAAGATSGFMNAAAGVGGPALSLYAVGTNWKPSRFVATAQVYALLLNLGSVIAKGGLPRVGMPVLVTSVSLALVGVGLGQALVPRVRAEAVRRVMVGLAMTGGLILIGRGLQAVLA